MFLNLGNVDKNKPLYIFGFIENLRIEENWHDEHRYEIGCLEK